MRNGMSSSFWKYLNLSRRHADKRRQPRYQDLQDVDHCVCQDAAPPPQRSCGDAPLHCRSRLVSPRRGFGLLPPPQLKAGGPDQAVLRAAATRRLQPARLPGRNQEEQAVVHQSGRQVAPGQDSKENLALSFRHLLDGGKP